MNKNNFVIAQANDYYRREGLVYLFIVNYEDNMGYSWMLDGTGHSDFRLELIC